MARRRRRLGWLVHPVFIFVVAQVSWALLVLVWIYWYLERRKELDAAFQRLASEHFHSGHWIILMEGCILMGIILAGLYVIFVNQRKQSKLNKFKDMILDSVTHELKTPLASIRLYAETLLLREVSRPEQVRFLNRTLQETERLQKLIDSILISAINESEQATVPLEPLALLGVVEGCWNRAWERHGDSRNFTMDQSHLEDTGFEVRGNLSQLAMLFDNLLDNAVKYTAPGGTIQMYLSSAGNTFTVCVTDDGIGIDPAHLSQIFTKFYRIGDNRALHASGSGLGLWACRTIVQLHRGRIFAASEGKGKGAAFYVKLERNHRHR